MRQRTVSNEAGEVGGVRSWTALSGYLSCQDIISGTVGGRSRGTTWSDSFLSRSLWQLKGL